MFEFVRRHNRIMQILLFLLIFPSFVMFGVDGYNRFRDKGDHVAEVNGVAITQDEWDLAHRKQVEQLRAQMPNVDAKMFDTPQAKYVTLERMVQERLIRAATEQQLIQVSDTRLANTLRQDPTIASLRRADGTLDVERYRQLAAAQGLTPEGLEMRIRQDMAQRQVLAGVAETSFLPDTIANLTISAFFERREIQLATFLSSAHLAGLKPTEDELKEYLQKNQGRYQLPQTADIEYVVLDMASVEKDIVLPEGDLRTYYQQNQQAQQAKEERRASHILISAPKDMPQAERDKARQKAADLLAQVKKDPKLFAELARKFSQDPGSAAQGGDLDYISRGAMVKPFEDAVFALAVGDISDLVQTEFGYHIIQLTGVRKPKVKSFEEVRPEIEKELRRQQAQRKYAEVAEQFSNLVYEQPDGLKPIADKLRLTVRHASGVTPASSVKEPWAHQRVLSALFSTESIERKRNTEAVEVAPSQLVSARLLKYSPARALSLEETREALARDWALQRAAELARQQGTQALKDWQAHPEQQRFESTLTISRDQPGAVAPQVLDAAMRASAKQLPAYTGVDLGSQGYAVVKVNQVLPAQNMEQHVKERAQLAQSSANAQASAYLESLKAKLNARILVPKPGGV
jgi:peptidyl-prolyl cis-trans isomerase D